MIGERVAFKSRMISFLLGHINVARAIAFVYNQNRNVDPGGK